MELRNQETVAKICSAIILTKNSGLQDVIVKNKEAQACLQLS